MVGNELRVLLLWGMDTLIEKEMFTLKLRTLLMTSLKRTNLPGTGLPATGLPATGLLVWIAATMLVWVGISAPGRATDSPAAIDPAVLAIANTGDAAAEVKAGESCAARHDYEQAAAWYTKAANQGYVAGEVHLANLYRDGAGKLFPRDMEQAAAWYGKAAEQGDAGAQGTLGMLSTLGQGVPRSDVEAYYWLDLAAAVKGPNQEQYAANRQNVGTRITADELEQIEQRVAAWKVKHPRPE
jgi:hypothetical protein